MDPEMGDTAAKGIVPLLTAKRRKNEIAGVIVEPGLDGPDKSAAEGCDVIGLLTPSSQTWEGGRISRAAGHSSGP